MSARAERQGKHPCPWPLLCSEKTPAEEPDLRAVTRARVSWQAPVALHTQIKAIPIRWLYECWVHPVCLGQTHGLHRSGGADSPTHTGASVGALSTLLGRPVHCRSLSPGCEGSG